MNMELKETLTQHGNETPLWAPPKHHHHFQGFDLKTHLALKQTYCASSLQSQSAGPERSWPLDLWSGGWTNQLPGQPTLTHSTKHTSNQSHTQGLRSTQLRGIAAQRELEKHFYTTYLSPKEMFYSTQDGSYGNAVRRHAKPHTEYNKVNTSSSSAQDQNLKHILERFMQPLGPCQSHQMIVTMKLNKT